MKILLVGGAGHVGSFITPYLRQHHDLRVLDLRPPRHEGIEYVEGSVTDPEALRRALDGVDAFAWLVMQKPQGGASVRQDIPTIQANYEVNCKGLHTFLFVAQEMGVTRGVYTSSMSVHYRLREPTVSGRLYEMEELTALDTPTVYGLSKGFGELICQYFARWFDMNLIALRITGPRTREQYLEQRKNYQEGEPPRQGDRSRIWITDEEDLAEAYHLALQAVQTGHGRFDAIFIAGDEHEREHNLSKARRLLGWQPHGHERISGSA